MNFTEPNFNYKYAPILSISPAEMSAIQELPDKDKDLILPIFPLRGWVGSQKLESTIKRISKAIGNRYWIANVDETFFTENTEYLLTGTFPREVFLEVQNLVNPKDGYDNWFKFIQQNSYSVPCLLWGNPQQIEVQIEKLNSLGRGLVLLISSITNPYEIREAVRVIKANNISNVFIIIDLGQINSTVFSQQSTIESQLLFFSTALPSCLLAITASSFPSTFSGYNKGENPIYERILFNKIKSNYAHLRLIYSDRGSARSEKISGGGGIPSPRIDYPLEHDWRFIREEFSDSKDPQEGEKQALYSLIARKIINEQYWEPNLKLWGTQLIELTSKNDAFGINSPIKATAVRINIHLHLQLHYGVKIGSIDTDDDWTD